MDVSEAYCSSHVAIYVSRGIMLSTLSFYKAVCQLYLNRTGKKWAKSKCIFIETKYT